MVLSEKLIKLVNYRIQQEEFSARIYKSMSVYLNFHGYVGAAKLWQKYSDEEMAHAKLAYEYLLDLDLLPVVPALEAPPADFKSLQDVIKRSFEHEMEVTNQCMELASQAVKEGDFMLLHFAQSYLDEQREEIAKTTLWINKLESFGTSKEALRLLDNDMLEASKN